MPILLLGINYRTATTDLRDRLALAADDTRGLLSKLIGVSEEVVVLSTCNRTEVYAAASEDAMGPLLAALSDYTQIPVEELSAHCYRKTGEDAVYHLLSVASGLDSIVLGESQILGQVKQAWDLARANATTGPVLNTLGRYALEAGKDIRSRTSIARGATSVAHAAVELARQKFGRLTDRNVLVLGAGETGRVAALNLLSAGVKGLSITNRTYARAQSLAGQLRGTAIPFDLLPSALEDTDILIACSSSPAPLVTARMLDQAIAKRPHRPMLLIDIAAPRNVEPAARHIPGVALLDMDDLHRLCERNRHVRILAAKRAERTIREWTGRFMKWQMEREVVPLIRQMRARAEEVRSDEVQQAMQSLPGLNERERAAVEAMSRAILQRLLHQPTVWLKQHSVPEQRHVLAQAWGLYQDGQLVYPSNEEIKQPIAV